MQTRRELHSKRCSVNSTRRERKQQEDLERAKAAQKLVDEKREADLIADNAASAEGAAAGAGSNLRIAGLVGLSVGVVLVGVGGYYAVDSGNISDKVSASPDFQPALEQEGKDAERNAYIFSGGWRCSISGRRDFVFCSWKRQRRESLGFTPANSSQQFGLRLHLSEHFRPESKGNAVKSTIAALGIFFSLAFSQAGCFSPERPGNLNCSIEGDCPERDDLRF